MGYRLRKVAVPICACSTKVRMPYFEDRGATDAAFHQLPAPMDESPDMTYPAWQRAVRTAPKKMPSRVFGATLPFNPIRTV